MAFCTQCGASLADGVQFCVQCGARQQGQSSAPASPAPAAPSSAPPQNRGLVKILVFVLGIFALVILLVVAGSVYVGYRVKRKAEQLSAEVKKQWEQAQGEKQPSEQSQPHGSTAAQTQGEQVSSDQSCPALDAAQSQAFQAAASASIPLKPGLTLINIYTNQALAGKEVEVLTTIQGIESARVTVQAVRTEPGSPASTRIVCIAGLLNSRRYETYFGGAAPELVADSTMFSASRAVFEDLKPGRAAEFEYIQAAKSEGGGYHFLRDDKGQLSRVEPDDVPYSVIVNADNIGGDAYNMTLSARRAEAVKQALITRYQIPESTE